MNNSALLKTLGFLALAATPVLSGQNGRMHIVATVPRKKKREVYINLDELTESLSQEAINWNIVTMSEMRHTTLVEDKKRSPFARPAKNHKGTKLRRPTY